MTNNRSIFMLLIMFAFFLLPSTLQTASAQGAQVTGIGTYQYEGRYKKKAYEGYKTQAIDVAVMSAWSRYIATLSQTRQIAYQKSTPQFTNDLGRFVNNIVILDENHDKKGKVVEVMIRATINQAAVDTAFNMNSSVQQTGGSGSMFSFIFSAREAVSVKSYLSKEVRVRAREKEAVASEEVVVDGGSVSSSESIDSFEKTTSGGSSERKADAIMYNVTSAEDIDSAMGEILSTYGYEVVKYGDVVSNCGGAEPDDIRYEFSDKDEMSRQTRKSAIDASRDCEVSFFATGTIDIGLKERDPISGNQRVYVSVRGQVWDITRRLPRKVASVGPIQFAGLGPDQIVAQRNALILASKEAAQSLVDQMNAKGLR